MSESKNIFDEAMTAFDVEKEAARKDQEARLRTAIEGLERRAAGIAAPEFLLQFFAFSHLSANLQEVSKPFCEMAQRIVDTLPRNQERTVALRKLLEAKDCAVRAFIAKETA